MKYFILFLFLTLALLAGCDDEDPITGGPPLPEVEIVPTAVGNQWWGTLTRSFVGGGVIRYTLSYQITDDTVMVGKTWYKEEHFRDGILVGERFLSNFLTGVYALDTSLFPDSTILMHQYPTERGNSYDRYGYGDVSVGATDTAISTPAGAFTCVHYRTLLLSEGYLNEFVAPEVGYVKFEIYRPDGANGLFLADEFRLDSIVFPPGK